MSEIGKPVSSPMASGTDSIVSWDASTLSARIRRKDVSCLEVMQGYLSHIERVNPSVNALVAMREPEVLLNEAREADRLLAADHYLGWMHGMPQAPKDLASCRGLSTRKGSPLTPDTPDVEDSAFVARMRRAGALFIGKTNVSEFGLGSNSYNSVYGITRNPYDLTRIAGGSSGGAGAALALRMLAVADGSDMMGSLRNPAAFNNVYGFRPTQGRVPYGGTGELFLQQLSTEGPMGRTPVDIARLFSTQAGYDRRCPLSRDESFDVANVQLERNFRGARLGWLGDCDGYLPIEAGILTLCESALADFTELGCHVEPTRVPYSMAQLWQTWLTHRHWLVGGALGAYFADPASRAQLKPEAQWEVEQGLGLTAADVHGASMARSDWYRALHASLDDFDFLVLPSAQVFPFEAQLPWPKHVAGRSMDTYHRWMEVVIGPSLAGVPAMSVPVGFNAQGLPMGMQIIGRSRDDLGVLQLAHAYHAIRRWSELPPASVQA